MFKNFFTAYGVDFNRTTFRINDEFISMIKIKDYDSLNVNDIE